MDENNSLHKYFEEIKHIAKNNGVEFWYARELMPLLGYSGWQVFEDVIHRAGRSAMNSGEDVDNHFKKVLKKVQIGSNASRKVVDWKLDRYACYLITQNSSSSKEPVALAQTYFAIQTRRQEITTQLENDKKRLFIRDEVTDKNKKLFSTAKKSGVEKFGLFNHAGYKGLYGMSLAEIEKKKKLKKGELLDKAGSTELAANLFRITQTDEKLINDDIRSEAKAVHTHNMISGKIRQTIKNIGGVLPEDLKPEQHIKLVRKKVKELKKSAESKKILR